MNKKQYCERLGIKFKHHREMYGFSQVELAKRLKTSQTNICRWEKGIHKIPIWYLQKFFKVCHFHPYAIQDFLY